MNEDETAGRRRGDKVVMTKDRLAAALRGVFNAAQQIDNDLSQDDIARVTETVLREQGFRARIMK